MYGRIWLIEIRSEELLFESDMRLQFRYDLEKKQCPNNFLMQSTSLEQVWRAFQASPLTLKDGKGDEGLARKRGATC